jgi:hypothetical protein
VNGSEGSFSDPPEQDTGKNANTQWVVIGAGLIGLCILFFVLLRPASSPLATKPTDHCSAEKPVPAAEKYLRTPRKW